MIVKFVVYNSTTGEYFKRGYGFTTEQKFARLYSRKGDAANSLNRKRAWAPNFDVYPVNMDLSVVPATAEAFDTFTAMEGVEPMKFKVVVDYFRDVYGIDIAGTLPSIYPVSVDIIDVFHKGIKHLSGPNGVRFLLTEGVFESALPLMQMLGAEIMRQFGYTSAGKRVAFFEVDWYGADGKHNVYDY